MSNGIIKLRKNMKKVILAAVLFSAMASLANAGMKYECWVYKNGSPWKMTYVVADNKSQAVSKAEVKFRNLGRNGDYVKCK